jgi:hypothetical protein
MKLMPPLPTIKALPSMNRLSLDAPILNARAAEAVSRLARETGLRGLHLDLGGVEYLGSAGLNKLLELQAVLKLAGGGVRLGAANLTRLATLGNAAR